jgi:putative uncharacterized protein (fragment)
MAKRRKLPNGTGSIERVKKTPQGKTRLNQYRARLPAKKGRKDIGFYKTYNEAMDALINYQEPEKTETFKALYEKVKQTEEYRQLTRKTQLRYNTSFEKFKNLHNQNITDIVYTDLQEVIDDMRREGYTVTICGQEKHKDYSTESIKYLRFVVNKIYKMAIQNNISVTNLAPELKVKGKGEGRQKQIFSKKEIQVLSDNIENIPNARHILVLIYTGMRPGEYYNLKRSNIDFEKNTIKSFGIKTDAGKERIMYIHPKIRNMLIDLAIESQSGYLLEYNDKPIKYDKIFYDKIYYPTLKELNIERKIPYTCRYTFATMAHNAGVDDKALQSLMGHTDFTITANSYIQDESEYIYSQLKKVQ